MNKASRFLHKLHEQHQIDEAVKLIEDILRKKTHFVVHWGAVGWFDVYQVTPAPPLFEGEDLLGEVHSVDHMSRREKEHYEKNGVLLREGEWSNKVVPVIEDTTKALTKIGFRRQRRVLALMDLQDKRNPITGIEGGVGGFAHFTSHGIAVDTGIINWDPKQASTILAHEWAHMQWRQFSKQQKRHIHDWWEVNVVGRVRSETEDSEELVEEVKNKLAEYMWKDATFSLMWNEMKLDLNSLLLMIHLWRNHIGRMPQDKTEFMPTAAAISGISYGELNATLRDDLEMGDGIAPKGHEVKVKMSLSYKKFRILSRDFGQHTLPVDSETKLDQLVTMNEPYGLRGNKEEVDAMSHWMMIYDYLLSKKYSPSRFLDFMDNTVTFDHMVIGAMNKNRWIIEESPFNMTNVGQSAAFHIHTTFTEWLSKQNKLTVPSGAALGKVNPEIKQKFVDIVRDVIELEPQRVSAGAISTPSGEWMRNMARKLDIVPTAYSASNPKELWADLVAYAAFEPSRVPDEIMNMMRDVIANRV